MRKQWPVELKALLNDDPKNTVALQVDDYPGAPCPNCGGSGLLAVYCVKSGPYKYVPQRKGKWLDFPTPDRWGHTTGWYMGETKYAWCPVCRNGLMQNYLEQNCGLEGKDLAISLSDFQTNDRYEGKAGALSACQNLLAANQAPCGFVTFYGLYGRGKTHLLKGLVNGFRRINVTGQYWVLSDLLADVRERFSDENGTIAVESMIEEYRHVRVLALDEINGYNPTGWSNETINRLLDYRYSKADQFLTVMALNVHPLELPRELQYLTSRMKQGMIVEVGGVDVREIKGPGLKDWTV